MARMPRARRMPTKVAQSMIDAEVGMLDLVSMLIPDAAAVILASLSCRALSGLVV